MDSYDVIIIGSGTAGQSAATELAGHGLTIALVEGSDRPGGVCALRGCQAKKWFYEAAEAVARCRHLQGIGIPVQPQADWNRILAQKNDFTAAIPKGTVNSLEDHGIDFIQGTARFLDGQTLQANGRPLQADYFLIASGAEPAELPFGGSEHLATSSDFLDLEELPSRIAFIGGGFTSFEFAHYAARLGAAAGDVHILEAAPRPLMPFDADMVSRLVEASQADGITVHTDQEITGVEKVGGAYRIHRDSSESLEVDLVVNGAGRTPAIDGLDLDKAGVQFSQNGIEVDSSMRTANKAVFAAGDCVNTLQLARVADREAQVAAGAIVAARKGAAPPVIDYRTAPSILFTYPQLGMVGKTEQQLIDDDIDYRRSYEIDLGWPTYRRLGMHHAAFKILVDQRGRILGAHFLLDNTTGVVNTFKQAMIDEVTVAKLHKDNIMSPYPSRESDIISMLEPLVE